MDTHRSYLQTLAEFASLSAQSLRKEISRTLLKQSLRIVVLDDDPTGIQTVHDCLLLTDWKPENIEKAFADDIPIFYLLTNTRSMPPDKAAQVVREAMQAVVECNRKLGFNLIFISRSDSTLRGHFPLETDVMKEVLNNELQETLRPVFFIPSFFEAGRYTIGGTHYLKDKDVLIPVSETEFARDNVFGYAHAKLNEYIVEKTQGAVGLSEIGQITLESLRRDTVDDITKALEQLKSKTYITVDALGYDDLWKFSAALLQIISKSDSCVVLRTSSSLPNALSGMGDKKLLKREELTKSNTIGIFVVGSHVKKSSTQLSKLLESSKVKGIELDVKRILEDPDRLRADVRFELEKCHKRAITPVVYTSREEIRLENPAERLRIGELISAFLVRVVQELPFAPAYIVAKGGITSHDILTKGLHIDVARVAGQILPGVPVVKTAADHRWPEIPYIIFPGNVGDNDALVQTLEKLG
jgi:uncharacterized protein YgbK (DUF1537 family)